MSRSWRDRLEQDDYRAPANDARWYEDWDWGWSSETQDKVLSSITKAIVHEDEPSPSYVEQD